MRRRSIYRWSDYLNKICAIVLSRHQLAHLIILLNDRYDIHYSIKDDEHDRRAAKCSHIPNVYPKVDDPFPSAADFNKFMFNSGNKVRLQKLVKQQLEYHVDNVEADVIYCDGQKSINLTTRMESQAYTFNHPEADTMLVAVYWQLRCEHYNGVVILDSEDTDVYVQAAYASYQLDGELLIKRKNHLINTKAMLPEGIARIIIHLPLHIIWILWTRKEVYFAACHEGQ